MGKKDLIWGIHSIEEALSEGVSFFKVLVNKETRNPKIIKLLATFKKLRIPVQKVPNEKLNKLTNKNHQGIVAYVSPIEFYELNELVARFFEEGKEPLFLVLDGVSDVRNFGSIVRSAVCMGVDAIVIPNKGSALINNDAVKTSSGAIFKVPFCRSDNLFLAVKYLSNSGFTVVAASEKGSTLTTQIDFSGPVAIVMGDEGKGVSESIIKKANFLVRIPMVETFDSLNVSVATGIILYEAFTQRKGYRK
jgi:23S rRNA (guanosine2251-2'-O)-methyltransferase